MYLAEEAQWPKTVEAIAQSLTFLALIGGGIFTLNRYLRSLRVKTAEMLLAMEKEYRLILPICLKIENREEYEEVIKPILDGKGTPSVRRPNNLQEELDRALRFFYICTVLHGELHVEQNVIGRAYYYYLRILAHEDGRIELREYVKKFYFRLDAWLMQYEPCLEHYKKTGEWNDRLKNKKKVAR